VEEGVATKDEAVQAPLQKVLSKITSFNFFRHLFISELFFLRRAAQK
jgi:hypothetical protein